MRCSSQIGIRLLLVPTALLSLVSWRVATADTTAVEIRGTVSGVGWGGGGIVTRAVGRMRFPDSLN